MLLTITLHELGHVLAAWRFNVPVKQIGLNWRGAYVRRGRTTGWPEVAICLAGPYVNFLLAAYFWQGCHWFALLNLCYAVVNVLPIPKSDGTHALEALRA